MAEQDWRGGRRFPVVEQADHGAEGVAAYWAGRYAAEAGVRAGQEATVAESWYWFGRAECPADRRPEDGPMSWRDGFASV